MRLLSVTSLYFIVSFLSSSKAHGAGVYEDSTRLNCLQHATRQLEEALTLMKKHYYKKDEVNWDSLIGAAKNRITTAGSCDDAYATVNWCFRQMSESHSFIMPAKNAALYTNDTTVLKSSPPLSKLVGELNGELLTDASIAYLTVPWVSTTDAISCTRIADSIQFLIAELDKQGVNKWIVDLRNNSGGNCWPMIAGLGPLIGEGVCGYFVSSDEKLPIIYRDGASWQGKHIRCQVTNAYKTVHEKKWIIVLTSPKTASSGEIVALAFKGKEGSLIFGQPTAGLTTANASYPLSDKSLLVLTVCMEADRTGRIMEGKILPDQFVSPEKSYSYEDPARSAAIMWLQMQQ